MRLLVQVVKEAKVTVNQECTGSIGKGVLVFFGAHVDDKMADTEWLAEKLVNLRIFPDSDGKMNLSLKDVDASALIVSQFTLYGDCSQGRRPSFTSAAPPAVARPMYDHFVSLMKTRLKRVETGIFGEHMDVSLIDDGPLTFLIERN